MSDGKATQFAVMSLKDVGVELEAVEISVVNEPTLGFMVVLKFPEKFQGGRAVYLALSPEAAVTLAENMQSACAVAESLKDLKEKEREGRRVAARK